MTNKGKARHRYSPKPLRIAIRVLSHIVIALSVVQAWLIQQEGKR